MADRRERGLGRQRSMIVPAMVVYVVVMALAPWMHLRAHDGNAVAAVLAETPLSQSGDRAIDVCDLCRLLGGSELPVEAARGADAWGARAPDVQAAAPAPRRPTADARPRAPPAPRHAA